MKKNLGAEHASSSEQTRHQPQGGEQPSEPVAPLQGQQEQVNVNWRKPAVSKTCPATESPRMINSHMKKVERLTANELQNKRGAGGKKEE